MAFIEKKLPADAPVIDKALNWVDSRFPLTKLWKTGVYPIERLVNDRSICWEFLFYKCHD